ncbi:hypothetical protein FQA47_021431 [Oryzias melastigma]|uniref:Uncharacterized protein n=1 Tax=Oryzias melastigma TaxID=30732 RepID=A0A834C648_ORYME|nr:hypothetical protein FQA47_021431 [Oryzias melastigma]
MPSERTAEGTWRGACLRGRDQWRNQDRSCLQPEKLADEARMETKHETFCIVPHPTAESTLGIVGSLCRWEKNGTTVSSRGGTV